MIAKQVQFGFQKFSFAGDMTPETEFGLSAIQYVS